MSNVQDTAEIPCFRKGQGWPQRPEHAEADENSNLKIQNNQKTKKNSRAVSRLGLKPTQRRCLFSGGAPGGGGGGSNGGIPPRMLIGSSPGGPTSSSDEKSLRQLQSFATPGARGATSTSKKKRESTQRADKQTKTTQTQTGHPNNREHTTITNKQNARTKQNSAQQNSNKQKRQGKEA